MSTPQINIRAPEEARPVLQRIAARLRENPAFVAQLSAYLDELDDGTVDDTIAARVARLESRLDALVGGKK